MDANDKIRSLLRASEHLVAGIQTVLVHSTSQSVTTPESFYLAIVAHTDPLSGHEEGSLFILLSKPNPTQLDPFDLEVQQIFPIVGDFYISMAQSKRNTVDLRSDYPVSPLDQSRGGFILNIYPGQGTSPSEIQMLTYNIQDLRPFLDEYKKLKNPPDDTVAKEHGIGSTYSWIAPYVHREPVWSLSTIPRDLRLVHKPIQQRLSTASPGIYGDELTDVHHIMDDWLHTEARQAASRGKHPLSLRIGTFNVNGQLPSQDLSSWLRNIPISRNDPKYSESTLEEPTPSIAQNTPSISQSSISTLVTQEMERDADLIVLGFQELDLSAEALIYSSSTSREDSWSTAIFAALGEKAEEYEKLASKQLVGMLMIILAKKELLPCLDLVHSSAVGAGLMGFMGNKGGVGIRVQFTPPEQDKNPETSGPTTLTFINSHLAAYDEMVDRRNQDFHDICTRLSFNISDSPMTSTLPVSLFESDAVFWMGDLNYRIDIPDIDVRTILSAEHWVDKVDALLEYDQLKRSMRSNKAFELFNEFPIAHFPTYRFSSGVSTDQLGYDIKRRPAWCDRILHLVNQRTVVTQVSYQAHPQITQSDHLPVSAQFHIDADRYSMTDLTSVAKTLHRKLRGLDVLDEKGQLALTPSSIDFGKIKHTELVPQTLKIHNPGKLARAFRFIPMEDERDIGPRWLRVSPQVGIVLAGQDVEITITAQVDDQAASDLNFKFSELNATLVVHEMFGKDCFCLIQAQYEPTCLANNVPILTRLPGPIRTSDHLLPDDRPINAPREIMRLVNWMMTYCENQEDLFVSNSDPLLVREIIECLDTGEEFSFAKEDVDSRISTAVGAALLKLLDSMTEPVVPAFLHEKCGIVQNRDEAFELLDEFPPAAVNVWISVTAFLHYVCESAVDPVARAQHIASTFAPILMKHPQSMPTTMNIAVSPLSKYNFLLLFLT